MQRRLLLILIGLVTIVAIYISYRELMTRFFITPSSEIAGADVSSGTNLTDPSAGDPVKRSLEANNNQSEINQGGNAVGGSGLIGKTPSNQASVHENESPSQPPNRYKSSQLSILEHLPLLPIIFPNKDDWRVKKALLVYSKDKNVFVIFKKLKNTNNEKIFELENCNIVILADDPSEEERYRRAIVIETTGKTSLTFKNNIGINGSFDFSSFEEGQIEGWVTIRCAMKKKETDDDLVIRTWGLSFKSNQLVTNGEVDFKFGGFSGDGSGLAVNLNMPRQGRFFSDSASLENDSAPLQKIAEEGNLANGISLERISLNTLGKLTLKLDGLFEQNGKEDKNLPKAKDIDIMCRHGISIIPSRDETGGWLARFNDDVQVNRNYYDAPKDTLTCKSLNVLLVDEEIRKMVKDPVNKTFVDSMNRRKKNITGRLSELSPLRMEADRSEKDPVRIESPANLFEAESDKLTYVIPEKSFILRVLGGGRRVSLTYDQTKILAEAVQYEPGQKNSFGVFNATKNGQITSTFETKKGIQRLRLQWGDALQIARDPVQSGFYRVAMKGGLVFDVNGIGTVKAMDGDIWLLADDGKKNGRQTAQTFGNRPADQNAVYENDRYNKEDSGDMFKAVSANSAASGSGAGNGLGALGQCKPHSAVFHGKIQMSANNAEGQIYDELGIRFQEIVSTSSENASGQNSAASSAFGVSPQEKTGSQLSSQTIMGGNGETKIFFEARTLNLWMLSDGREMKVHKLALSDNVSFQEMSLIKPDDTMNIRGAYVEIMNLDSPDTMITLSGKNSSFVGKGLNLFGDLITLNRRKNSFSVNGPGRLNFNIQTLGKPRQGKINLSGPLEVVWSKNLVFDGQTLAFLANDGDDVIVSHALHTLKCPEVRLTAAKKINLFAFNDGDNLMTNEIALIDCIGREDQKVQVSLYLDSPIQSSDGSIVMERAHFQGEVQSFVVDYSTKNFTGRGPGWFRGVMKMPADGSSVTAAPTIGAGTSNFPRKPWGHLHLVFQDLMKGNIDQKFVSFQKSVQAAYCETDQQKAEIDAAHPSMLPPKSLSLNSDELQLVFASAGERNDQPKDNFELIALGSVFVNFDTVIGRGNSLTYSNGKRKIILQGSGNDSPASLYEQKKGGLSSEIGRFLRASYNLDSGQLDVADFSNSN